MSIRKYLKKKQKLYFLNVSNQFCKTLTLFNMDGIQILSDIIVYTKYAKHLPLLNRRETWEEIVDRYVSMMTEKYPQLKDEILENKKYILNKEILPSMRALQFAGDAMLVNNSRGYNCSYLPVDSVNAFPEIMFLLLGGTGVGYSVQKHHVEQLPEIKQPGRHRKYVIEDSIMGWADAVKVLMKAYLYGKFMPRFDFSQIRPKGTLLKTAGGKAPGPEPLKTCLFHIQTILDRKKPGEKLTPLECHDIICHIANSVLAGGIRRSACIALFSKDDYEMITCKYGSWWELNEQRGRANNSVVLLRSETSREEFDSLFEKIKLSNSGEPGIFWTNDINYGTNPCCFVGSTKILTADGYKEMKDCVGQNVLINAKGEKVNGIIWSNGYKDIIELTLSNKVKIKCTPDHRFILSDGSECQAADLLGKRLMPFEETQEPIEVLDIKHVVHKEEVFDFSLLDDTHLGVIEGVIAHNCEIALNGFQFCNLTEINTSTIKDQKDFENRAKAAAFFGTLQAGFTDFHYIRNRWKSVTERDALLGIGMTGIATGTVLKLDMTAAALKAKEENIRVSGIIGINPAKRITCVKPSGTTSLVLGCSSGIHAWYSNYYLRTIRFGKDEPISKYMLNTIPEICEDDVIRPHDTLCVRIPIKAPDNCIIRTESAIDTLERVKKVYKEWILPGHIEGTNTHNVSVTIYVRDNEWDTVKEWMWKNRDYYTGISLLPYDNGSYVQAPFEEITEQQYYEKAKYLKNIDLSKVIEEEDSTDFTQIAACAGGACEIG